MTERTLVERLRGYALTSSGSRVASDLMLEAVTALAQAQKEVAELAEAVWGNWIASRDDDGLYGCEYCPVRFELEAGWMNFVHDANCIVNKARALKAR